jgi:POT family proton-dependent oligopeptide transporter
MALVVALLARARKIRPRTTAGLDFIKKFSAARIKAIIRLIYNLHIYAMFWSLYDQMDSAWVPLAEKMNRHFSDEIAPVANRRRQRLSDYAVHSSIFLYLPAISRIFPLTSLRKIGIGMFVIAFALSSPLLFKCESQPVKTEHHMAFAGLCFRPLPK